MVLEELIPAIAKKNSQIGFTKNPPATREKLLYFEQRLGFEIPLDFHCLYLYCDGFGTTDDIFNIISIDDILAYDSHYGFNWFYLAEYMIFSDMWAVRVAEESYEIYNVSHGIVLTNSLEEFLARFLRGNVFENGGLYDWQAEVSSR